MKKTKIALVIRGFHSGGIERVFETYYSHMDLSPYEIHVVTNMKNMPDRQAIFEKMGCIVHPLSPMRGHKFTWKNIKEYRDLFKNGKFDIVHSNVPDNLLPLYFSKKYGVPIRILHAHNIYTDDFAAKKKIVAALYRKGFAINASNATKLIAVSRLAAVSAFADRSNEAIILRNAIDLEKFAFSPRSREKIREQLGVADDQILFGHVGRYENDQKNQEFVLGLFCRIAKAHENCRLVMIGEGPRRQEYMEMAQELGIDEKIVFTGAIPNVNEYLSAMDIFLFPSRKEGLGIACIEAQASGVASIFSNKIPKEAIITSDVTILGIEDENAIDDWLAHIEAMVPEVMDKDFIKRNAAQEYVKDAGFDIRSQAERLAGLYQMRFCGRR